LAANNHRILKLGISTHRAAAYLEDLGMRPFDIDMTLYHAELWARRQGSEKPIYPLREGQWAIVFDLLTCQRVGGRLPTQEDAA
jgi:hypothetical protein